MTGEVLHKFDVISDKGLFMGDANNSRAYLVYNNCTMKLMESTNVLYNDSIQQSTDNETLDIVPKSIVSDQDVQPSASMSIDQSSKQVSTTEKQPYQDEERSEETKSSTNQDDPKGTFVHKIIQLTILLVKC